ncbi:MAG: cytidylate kinase family protein [Clostridia bacterium]|nr:cytidylate kinase family protein [Clostridia bacterium]
MESSTMENQEEQSNKYLGEGKLPKLMLKFSLPCVLSLVISALYNIVDQIFVGNSELSVLGNAATGVVFPIFIIAQAFAWWFGDGCGAYLNICQGRKNSQNAHKAIGTGIVFTVAASVILMAIFYPLQRPILLLFGASDASIGYAIEYFNIILGFFPVFMAMNMMNAVVRADGAPGWSMASMLSGAITNIVLDAAFIIGLKWGMSGAAWATVIGQTVSFVISLLYFILKTKTFKMKLKSFIPDFKEFANPVKLGMSSFITQMTIVIISLVCNIMLKKYGAMSSYGEDIPISIIAVESKVFTVVINIVVGIVLGCQPIIGFNMGAKKFDRVKKLYLYILLSTLAVGLIFTILFEAAPSAVVGIFGDPDPTQVDPEKYWEFGVKVFRIFLMLVTFTCTIKMTSIFFQASGKPVFAIIASLVRDIVCFIPLICTLPLAFDPGIEGILWAAPAADLVAIIVAAALTVVFLKSLKNDNPEKAEEATEAVLKPSVPGVIITIGREHGSLGKQIGKVVAERLNIPFYYKEMTALAAQESGLDKEFISDLNKSSNFLYDLYLSCEPVQQAITAQDKIIRKIADNGSCVIVGRAADYVLREYKNVVKVFVHAPEEYRIKKIAEFYGDSEEDAKKNLKRSDGARAAYYKNVSGLDWGDAKNYNLCVDSSVGVDKSADIICDFVKDKS